MNASVETLRDTIVPKSDQLNADDLLTGPMTVTITEVRRGDKDQPVSIGIVGHQPYKPCKSMRRVLISAWGDDGRAWAGRKMTLYCDPNVMFGGVKVGGIRISHLSHIDNDMQMSLTATRGKKAPYLVKVLSVAMYPAERFEANFSAWESAIKSGKYTAAKMIARIEQEGALTAQQKQALANCEQKLQPEEDWSANPETIRSGLENATTLDQLEMAAGDIENLADADQRSALQGLYDARRTELQG